MDLRASITIRRVSVFRRMLVGMLVVGMVLGPFGTTGQLAANDAPFLTKAKYAFLMDYETGAVLYQKSADELFPPASMSKLMTMAVIFRALKEGKLRPDDEFETSEHAWRTGGAPSRTAAMFLSLGKTERLSEIIQGLAVQSGNDAAITVAEGMAGSEEKFAELMETEARRIGLTRSTFGNPTGLPNERQRMTARELAMLAEHLISEYPEYYRVFRQQRFTYKGRYKFVNRNRLVFLDIGVDGLKTGFTKESGYGLVGSGEKDGRRLIFVVAGLSTKKDRDREARRLYEYGLNSFKEFSLYDAGEVVSEARVWGGSQFYVPLVGRGPVKVLLPKYSTGQARLRARVHYNGPLKPPIRAGTPIARLVVSTSSNSQSEVPLYARDDVQPASLLGRGLDSLFFLAFGWAF